MTLPMIFEGLREREGRVRGWGEVGVAPEGDVTAGEREKVTQGEKRVNLKTAAA